MSQTLEPIVASTNLQQLNEKLSGLGASDRLERLSAEFRGKLLLSSSFGLQAAVLLHMVRQHAPEIPIIFIDTGYHFPETYRYMEQLCDQLDIEVDTFVPKVSAARQEALWGKLWEQGPERLQQYSLMNKIEPMDRALKQYGAKVWISGLRRSQASSRSARAYIEAQNGTLKAYPILDWSDQQVDDYFTTHDLPQHPLKASGYVTMGDWHSTRPPAHGENAEETRFNGQKYECGLHLDSGVTDFQI